MMPQCTDTALLDRFPQSPPAILPLPDGVQRPLWSVMIPAYNCAEYLVEALSSVLAQAPGPEVMQIQVVDDASTDADVEALVHELGGGRVEYYRQPVNVGSLRNFETCINRARGHLVHLLHADDRVLPGFYLKMGQLFEEYPTIGSAASHYATINDAGERVSSPRLEATQAGILPNWLFRIGHYQSLQYVCTVVRRSVYEHLGSFYGTNYAEDWEMWVRIARYYPVAYLPETLAEYRNRDFSISWQRTRSTQLVPDLLHAMHRIQQHLPAAEREQASRLAREYWACSTVAFAYRTLRETNDKTLAYTQLKQAFELSHRPLVYFTAFKFLARLVLRNKFTLKFKPLYHALRGRSPVAAAAPTTVHVNRMSPRAVVWKKHAYAAALDKMQVPA